MKRDLKERIYYMDSLRSTMMLLGVFYHAALIYGTQSWHVWSGDNNTLLRLLTEILHTFRMPTFFVVSGFFSALILCRMNISDFSISRLKRVLIPIFFCGFSLNLLSVMLEDREHTYENVFQFILYGHWLGHLWFLGSLAVYYTLLYFFENSLTKIIESKISRSILIVSVLTISSLLIWLFKLPSNLHSVRYLFISLGVTIQYAPFFLFGYWLYKDEKFKAIYLNVKSNIIILISFFLVYFSLEHFSFEKHPAVSVFINHFCFLSMSGLVITFFQKALNFKSNWFYKLSLSSYSVYILHQPMLIMLYKTGISSGIVVVDFLLLSILVIILAHCFHMLVVERNNLVRLAINGK